MRSFHWVEDDPGTDENLHEWRMQANCTTEELVEECGQTPASTTASHDEMIEQTKATRKTWCSHFGISGDNPILIAISRNATAHSCLRFAPKMSTLLFQLLLLSADSMLPS